MTFGKLHKQIFSIERKQGFEAVFMDKDEANEKPDDNITKLLPKNNLEILYILKINMKILY